MTIPVQRAAAPIKRLQKEL